MTTPPPPHGNPADPPAEQPAWGQQPPGGWGEQPAGRPGRDGNVDPRAWGQGAPPAGQPDGNAAAGQPPGTQGWGQQADTGRQPYGGAPPYGQQPAGQPQYGQPQYGQPRYGQPRYGQQPEHGQQPAPYGQPADQRGSGQQAWVQPEQQAWGQHGQPPTQQWPGGQPQGGQQWGPGYPALPDVARPRSGPSKLPLILGGAGVLVVALVVVLGFVAPGFFVTRVFSAAAVQDGVQKVLTDEYGLTVGAVTCAEGVRVTQGASFDCNAVIDGESRSVPIRITSSDGRYEVGRPL